MKPSGPTGIAAELIEDVNKARRYKAKAQNKGCRDQGQDLIVETEAGALPSRQRPKARMCMDYVASMRFLPILLTTMSYFGAPYAIHIKLICFDFAF